MRGASNEELDKVISTALDAAKFLAKATADPHEDTITRRCLYDAILVAGSTVTCLLTAIISELRVARYDRRGGREDH